MSSRLEVPDPGAHGDAAHAHRSPDPGPDPDRSFHGGSDIDTPTDPCTNPVAHDGNPDSYCFACHSDTCTLCNPDHFPCPNADPRTHANPDRDR